MLKGTVFHFCGELHFGEEQIPLNELHDEVISRCPEYSQFMPEVMPAFFNYCAKYNNDDYTFAQIDNKPAVELEFQIELTPTIIYHGKLDQLRERSGKKYIFDWKVTSMALTDWYFKKFEMCYQTFSYSFTGRQCFDELDGFFIDAVQIKNGAHAFARKYFPLSPMYNEFVAELIRTGEWMQEHLHDENYFEHRYTSCINKYNKLCEYAPVCTSSPARREAILASQLYVDNKPIYDFSA
jgi:hypothetical protein